MPIFKKHKKKVTVVEEEKDDEQPVKRSQSKYVGDTIATWQRHFDLVRDNADSPELDHVVYLGQSYIVRGLGNALRSQAENMLHCGVMYVEWARERDKVLPDVELRQLALAHYRLWLMMGAHASPVNLEQSKVLYHELYLKENDKLLEDREPTIYIDYFHALQYSNTLMEADEVISNLIAWFPDHVDFPIFLFYKGVLLKAMSRHNEASEALFNSLQMGPPRMFTKLQMMFLMSRNIEEEYKDSLEPIQDAYAMVFEHMKLEDDLKPTDTYYSWIHCADIWIQLGDICTVHHQHSLAADLYGQGLVRDRKAFFKPKLWFCFAKACRKCGRTSDAQLALKQALTTTPDDLQLLKHNYLLEPDEEGPSPRQLYDALIEGSIKGIIAISPIMTHPVMLCAERVQGFHRGLLVRSQLQCGRIMEKKIKKRLTARCGLVIQLEMNANGNALNATNSLYGNSAFPIFKPIPMSAFSPSTPVEAAMALSKSNNISPSIGSELNGTPSPSRSRGESRAFSPAQAALAYEKSHHTAHHRTTVNILFTVTADWSGAVSYIKAFDSYTGETAIYSLQEHFSPSKEWRKQIRDYKLSLFCLPERSKMSSTKTVVNNSNNNLWNGSRTHTPWSGQKAAALTSPDTLFKEKQYTIFIRFTDQATGEYIQRGISFTYRHANGSIGDDAAALVYQSETPVKNGPMQVGGRGRGRGRGKESWMGRGRGGQDHYNVHDYGTHHQEAHHSRLSPGPMDSPNGRSSSPLHGSHSHDTTHRSMHATLPELSVSDVAAGQVAAKQSSLENRYRSGNTHKEMPHVDGEVEGFFSPASVAARNQCSLEHRYQYGHIPKDIHRRLSHSFSQHHKSMSTGAKDRKTFLRFSTTGIEPEAEQVDALEASKNAKLAEDLVLQGCSYHDGDVVVPAPLRSHVAHLIHTNVVTMNVLRGGFLYRITKSKLHTKSASHKQSIDGDAIGLFYQVFQREQNSVFAFHNNRNGFVTNFVFPREHFDRMFPFMDVVLNYIWDLMELHPVLQVILRLHQFDDAFIHERDECTNDMNVNFSTFIRTLQYPVRQFEPPFKSHKKISVDMGITGNAVDGLNINVTTEVRKPMLARAIERYSLADDCVFEDDMSVGEVATPRLAEEKRVADMPLNTKVLMCDDDTLSHPSGDLLVDDNMRMNLEADIHHINKAMKQLHHTDDYNSAYSVTPGHSEVVSRRESGSTTEVEVVREDSIASVSVSTLEQATKLVCAIMDTSLLHSVSRRLDLVSTSANPVPSAAITKVLDQTLAKTDGGLNTNKDTMAAASRYVKVIFDNYFLLQQQEGVSEKTGQQDVAKVEDSPVKLEQESLKMAEDFTSAMLASAVIARSKQSSLVPPSRTSSSSRPSSAQQVAGSFAQHVIDAGMHSHSQQSTPVCSRQTSAHQVAGSFADQVLERAMSSHSLSTSPVTKLSRPSSASVVAGTFTNNLIQAAVSKQSSPVPSRPSSALVPTSYTAQSAVATTANDFVRSVVDASEEQQIRHRYLQDAAQMSAEGIVCDVLDAAKNLVLLLQVAVQTSTDVVVTDKVVTVVELDAELSAINISAISRIGSDADASTQISNGNITLDQGKEDEMTERDTVVEEDNESSLVGGTAGHIVLTPSDNLLINKSHFHSPLGNHDAADEAAGSAVRSALMFVQHQHDHYDALVYLQARTKAAQHVMNRIYSNEYLHKRAEDALEIVNTPPKEPSPPTSPPPIASPSDTPFSSPTVSRSRRQSNFHTKSPEQRRKQSDSSRSAGNVSRSYSSDSRKISDAITFKSAEHFVRTKSGDYSGANTPPKTPPRTPNSERHSFTQQRPHYDFHASHHRYSDAAADDRVHHTRRPVPVEVSNISQFHYGKHGGKPVTKEPEESIVMAETVNMNNILKVKSKDVVGDSKPLTIKPVVQGSLNSSMEDFSPDNSPLPTRHVSFNMEESERSKKGKLAISPIRSPSYTFKSVSVEEEAEQPYPSIFLEDSDSLDNRHLEKIMYDNVNPKDDEFNSIDSLGYDQEKTRTLKPKSALKQKSTYMYDPRAEDVVRAKQKDAPRKKLMIDSIGKDNFITPQALVQSLQSSTLNASFNGDEYIGKPLPFNHDLFADVSGPPPLQRQLISGVGPKFTPIKKKRPSSGTLLQTTAMAGAPEEQGGDTFRSSFGTFQLPEERIKSHESRQQSKVRKMATGINQDVITESDPYNLHFLDDPNVAAKVDSGANISNSLHAYRNVGYSNGQNEFTQQWVEIITSFLRSHEVTGMSGPLYRTIRNLIRLNPQKMTKNEAVCVLADTLGSIGECLARLVNEDYVSEIRLVCLVVPVGQMLDIVLDLPERITSIRRPSSAMATSKSHNALPNNNSGRESRYRSMSAQHLRKQGSSEAVPVATPTDHVTDGLESLQLGALDTQMTVMNRGMDFAVHKLPDKVNQLLSPNNFQANEPKVDDVVLSVDIVKTHTATNDNANPPMVEVEQKNTPTSAELRRRQSNFSSGGISDLDSPQMVTNIVESEDHSRVKHHKHGKVGLTISSGILCETGRSNVYLPHMGMTQDSAVVQRRGKVVSFNAPTSAPHREDVVTLENATMKTQHRTSSAHAAAKEFKRHHPMIRSNSRLTGFSVTTVTDKKKPKEIDEKDTVHNVTLSELISGDADDGADADDGDSLEDRKAKEIEEVAFGLGIETGFVSGGNAANTSLSKRQQRREFNEVQQKRKQSKSIYYGGLDGGEAGDKKTGITVRPLNSLRNIHILENNFELFPHPDLDASDPAPSGDNLSLSGTNNNGGSGRRASMIVMSKRDAYKSHQDELLRDSQAFKERAKIKKLHTAQLFS